MSLRSNYCYNFINVSVLTLLAHLSWMLTWTFLIKICLLSIILVVGMVVVLNFSHLHLFLRTTGPISIKHGTKHPWVKESQVLQRRIIQFSKRNFFPILWYNHNFPKMCLLIGTVSQVSGVAHKPLVFLLFTEKLIITTSSIFFILILDFKNC